MSQITDPIPGINMPLALDIFSFSHDYLKVNPSYKLEGCVHIFVEPKEAHYFFFNAKRFSRGASWQKLCVIYRPDKNLNPFRKFHGDGLWGWSCTSDELARLRLRLEVRGY